jgi:hypothetical protein
LLVLSSEAHKDKYMVKKMKIMKNYGRVGRCGFGRRGVTFQQLKITKLNEKNINDFKGN